MLFVISNIKSSDLGDLTNDATYSVTVTVYDIPAGGWQTFKSSKLYSVNSTIWCVHPTVMYSLLASIEVEEDNALQLHQSVLHSIYIHSNLTIAVPPTSSFCMVFGYSGIVPYKF